MVQIDKQSRDDSERLAHACLFESMVDRVRNGEWTSEKAAGELLARLDQNGRRGMLDGDQRVWPGLADFFIRGYNYKPLVAGSVERLGIPGIRFTDGPRGVVMGRSTCFPVISARGASWDVALEQEIGRAIGIEARAQGANLFGGISADVLRHPKWGRAQESYGEDPVHVGLMGAALTTGVRNHVMACVKHFALYAIEQSRFSVDVVVDEAAMHEGYLPPFHAIVEAGADAVMSAYNSVNGEWAGQNRTLLTDILRDEWGFKGFVISDFIWGFRDAVTSLLAGLDVEMPFLHMRARKLPMALREGCLSPVVIDRAALRVLGGQLRHYATIEDPAPSEDVVVCDQHRALARRAAAAGMVLLRNEPEGDGQAPILPLGTDIDSIAVFGSLADQSNIGDSGSSAVDPPYSVSPLSGVRAMMPDTRVEYYPGTDVATAADVARHADIALVVVGWDGDGEGEAFIVNDPDAASMIGPVFGNRLIFSVFRGLLWLLTKAELLPLGGDRERLTLSEHEESLIQSVAAANARTIVVIVGGTVAVIESWRNQVSAILMAWYSGMEGGNALGDVLAGIMEPGGRLPTAIPADPAHLPEFDNTARQVRYDLWWGQRKLDRDGHSPAYPFGFGLGYATFELDDLIAKVHTGTATGADVGTVAASVAVRNTGERRGSTVVQLYAVASTTSSADRPCRRLLGFTKVEVDAGERLVVSICGTLLPLARRNATTRCWSLVPGPYRLEAAQYSGDPHAAATALFLEA